MHLNYLRAQRLGFCLVLYFEILFSYGQIRKVDLCIYGGTSAGVIAAYSAKKLGKSVILIEPSTHLGGMTSGGLSATDIGNKIAITGLSRDFFRRLGKHYGKFEHWLPEPKVAEMIFNQYINESGAEVIFQKRLSYVLKNGKKIKLAIFENVKNPKSEKLSIEALQFMDCTYEGDLMAQAGVAYTVGREDNKAYNETLSGVQKQDRHQFENGIDPWQIKGDSTSGLLWGINSMPRKPNGTGDGKVQAYNFRLCMTYDSLNRLPLPKPENYDPAKYELLVRLINSRTEKGWNQLLKIYFLINEIPNKKADWNNMGAFSTDYVGANWNYPEASYEDRAKIWKAHEDYQKGLLYFVANDPGIHPDVQKEMRKWGLPKDEFQENGGWPFQLYVREARRMIGEYVMTEHNCRGNETVQDGIGMAAYTMDSHNCDRHFENGMVKNEGNVEVGGFPPYPISFRSVVPKREECTNLTVPVCMSASHIAYGSIRMEPVFMVLAQTSAMAACMAIDQNIPVQLVNIPELQKTLKNNPLLNGTTSEILIDDDLHQSQITYTGEWKDGEEKTSKYGKSIKLAQNNGNNKARFNCNPIKSGKYTAYFYFPRFSGKANPDSVRFTISNGNKTKSMTKNVNEDLNLSNDNKGIWINLGAYDLKEKQEAWLEIQGMGSNQNAYIPADAVIWVLEK